MYPYLMRVHSTKRDGSWLLEHDGVALGTYATQQEAELAGHAHGARIEGEGRNAELLVFDDDGTVVKWFVFGRTDIAVSTGQTAAGQKA